MSAHATLSPSARHRWKACPASAKESLKYESKSSPSAVDGTRTHTLLELCIKGNFTAQSQIGVSLMDDDGVFEVDEARAERVCFALDYINSRNMFIRSETKVHPALPRNDVSGTVDVILLSDDTVEIIDYKDGVGEVSVVNNPQLQQYALGVLADADLRKICNLRMTIIQPKLRDFGKPAISYVDVKVDDFYEEQLYKLEVETKATDAPDAPYLPGEAQCKWCPHAGNCGARATHALGKSGITFGKVTVLEQSMELTTIDLTDAKIRDIIEALPMIKQFLESVEETALGRIQAGKDIDGLKVIRGRGTRSWSLPDNQLDAKLRKMNVPVKEIWQTKIISPAQLEKLKWVNTKGEQKTLTPKQLGVIKSELISTSEGKLTVVSAADERPAVEFKPVSFPAVEAAPDWMK